jgi:hypothetical protein
MKGGGFLERTANRRQLLRSAGVASLPLVAGCAEQSDSAPGTSDTPTSGTPPEQTGPTFTVERADVSLSVTDHGMANPGISLWNATTQGGVTYAANRWGNPVKAGAFDHESETVTGTYALPSGQGCLALEAQEDYVFFVTTVDGGVHRLDRESGTVEQLATFDVESVYTWSIESAPDGTLYAATSNNTHVYEIDPESGDLTAIGPLAESEKYAYDLVATEDDVYVGVGNTGDSGLYHVDRSTRETTRLLPDSITDFVSKVCFTGRYLICNYASGGAVIVDLESGSPGSLAEPTAVDPLPATFAVADGPGHEVHYPAFPSQVDGWAGDVHDPDQAGLYTYDVETGERERQFDIPGEMGPNQGSLNYRSAHITDGQYVGVMKPSAAKLAVLDLDSGAGGIYALEEEGMEPTAVVNQSVGEFQGRPVTNRHGKMYVHDLEDDSRTGVSVPGEVKRLVNVDDVLYLGIYTGAEFHVYDGESVRKLGAAEGQVRPLGLVYNEATDSVVMGTQPNYGAETGGAIAVLDRSTEAVTTYQNVIENQSVTSLATAGETVYGGASTRRGGGTKPVTEEARLAAFDLADGEKTWELVPVPGAGAIVELVHDDGRLVGIADSTVFSVDIDRQVVEDTAELGFGQHHERGPDGAFYGVVGGGDTGGLVRLDVETLTATHLRGDVFSHIHESEVVEDSIFCVDPDTWNLTEISGITDYAGNGDAA